MAKKQMPKWRRKLLAVSLALLGDDVRWWDVREIMSGRSKHRRGRRAHRGGKAAQARRAKRKQAARDRKRTFNQPYKGKG